VVILGLREVAYVHARIACSLLSQQARCSSPPSLFLKNLVAAPSGRPNALGNTGR